MEDKNCKIERILGIYTRLINGDVIKKSEEAKNYSVNERSIQRDIDDIRNYLELESIDVGYINSVVYDREKKGYVLEQIYKTKLTNSEILAICKILLDCRAFTKEEMTDMLNRLVKCCVPKQNQKIVRDLFLNEEFNYVEPRHGKVFIDKMWELGQAIHNHQYIKIRYSRLKGKAVVERILQPVAIMFSEYYFYLAAFIDDELIRKNFEVKDDAFPTIYRIDRIESLEVLDEKFYISYANRFEEGEFRKRVQFMFGGKLEKVKFKYKGMSVEAVLDRLPTAKILSEENGVYTISAEVFGKGIDMWLRSQGDLVELSSEAEHSTNI